MRKKSNKTTKSYKIIALEKTILPSLNWRGVKMIYPYTWNGYRRYARVTAEKLLKAIEWDLKKP